MPQKWPFGEMVKLLLDNGADIESQDKDKRTLPFHAASAFSQPDIAELLVSREASLDAQDRFGLTPVATAS
ncbi:hypothetical protein CORC01_12673 [Colletotrichum orchidophilum]|uniref:Uncharacterized protein n=1 Tax=Colletotrichum orchidophilum TaxID=1209926 RepID=A0A1G4AS96_9PEZI|nr:uncharacterized protein CORC01_12673 [Colletotrichum orchidophilum]OHE92034.1 hypothetical protein CORC01_12673 [Colletotrichum orchidophilum]